MNDRDTFAAAALTGLLGGRQAYRSDDGAGYAKSAWNIADAMLAARGDTTDLDAAPAAKASGRDSSAEAGTGDTRASDSAIVEAAAEVVYRAIMYDRGILYGWLASKSFGAVYEVSLFDIDGSMAQHSARDAAQKILAMAPPAPGVTLTDAEREAIAYFGRIDGPHYLPAANTHAATLRNLRARTAKEGE